MGRQQDFRSDNTDFAGVVAVLAVIHAVQLFAGAIGRRSDSGLSCTAFVLGHMKMI